MNPSEVNSWLSLALSMAIPLIVFAYGYGVLSEQVKSLEAQALKHEPVAIGVAELAVEVRSLKDVIAELRIEIHSLQSNNTRRAST